MARYFNDYDGVCPRCFLNDGYLNVRGEYSWAHWYVCRPCKTKWLVGENLYSTWQVETEKDWERNERELAGYETVKAVHRGDARLEVAAEIDYTLSLATEWRGMHGDQPPRLSKDGLPPLIAVLTAWLERLKEFRDGVPPAACGGQLLRLVPDEAATCTAGEMSEPGGDA